MLALDNPQDTNSITRAKRRFEAQYPDAPEPPELPRKQRRYLKRINRMEAPATLADLQRMAQIVAPELMEELYHLARNAKAENVRAAAIGMIFDRAYGKPNQPLEVTSDTSALPLEDRERLISMLAAIVPAPGAPMIEGTLAPAPAPAALEPSKRKRKAK